MVLVSDSSYTQVVGSDSLQFIDYIDSGFTYFYCVKAVDRVGNEGKGEISRSIFLDGEGGVYIPPSEDDGVEIQEDVSTIPYIVGPLDTLRFEM